MQISTEELREALSKALQKELPGERAQNVLEPITRKSFDLTMKRNPKSSAVLILIYPKNDCYHTVTMLRPQYDGVHSGQISFPGGQQEEDDQNLMQTAIRETLEEIGVKIDAKHIIGSLTNLYIPPSNFMVTPYVALINEIPQMKKDCFEVEKLIEVCLNEIIATEAVQAKTINLEKYGNIQVPCFVADNQIIWGATAMIMNELRALLQNILS